jgi:hypothetical protein
MPVRHVFLRFVRIWPQESGSESTVVKDDGKMYFSRARACLRRLEFLNLDW